METTKVPDTWERGDPYERYVGRWSRLVAPDFLTWLDIPAGERWLDVGCGTGALCAAIIDCCSPLSVVGLEPSAGFIRTARQHLAGRAVFIRGDAGRLPLAPAAVGGVVSGLVLNFLPDPGAALREMARVTRDGGRIGAYVWDYAGKMEFMRFFWDAVSELNPQAASLDEGTRFPLCNPDALRGLFSRTGLDNIEVKAIDVPTRFDSFADFWGPFLGGQGPGPAYVMALDPAERERLVQHLRGRLPATADGSISLIARAWAVRGTVGRQLSG